MKSSCLVLPLLSTLLLVSSLCAQPAPNKIAEVGRRVTSFYKSPTEKEFGKIQAAIALHQDAIVAAGKRNRFDRLLATFLARASQKSKFNLEGNGPIFDLARAIASKDKSNELAVAINDERHITPSKLDVWWVSFFATGETKYVELILEQLKPTKQPAKPQGNAVIRRTAQWSLRSNCRQHDAVNKFVEAALTDDDWKSIHPVLRACVKPNQTSDLKP